ncbi:hypothetical protein HRbin36_01576 [bacterium HR36]|nr:hypothetical protein HRbin36_01576 [bacterium HR36]
MVGQFDGFHQLAIRTQSAGYHPRRFKGRAVAIVELVAMSVPLRDNGLTIGLADAATLSQLARVRPQSHRPAFFCNLPLFIHQANDWMGRVAVEFRAVRLAQPEHVPGKLDGCALHPQTDAEKGNLFFPGVANGFDLSLDTAIAEAPRHQHPVAIGKDALRPIPLDFLSIHFPYRNPRRMGQPGVVQRFVDGFVCIMMADILAHHRNGHLMGRVHDSLQQFLPIADVERLGFQTELLHD